MKIADFDTEKKVLIVAEIGNNHEGSYALAEELIGLAASAGADAVKFQTITPAKLVASSDQGRITQLNRFKLTFKDFEKLSKAAKREKVLFLSTPFDLESARFLNDFVPAFKIASGDNNFYPLMEYLCSTGKPILMSTGLASLAQIRRGRQFILRQWQKRKIRQDLALLHCVSQYPVPMEQANVSAIASLAKINKTVGYSDHTLGIDACVLAVAMGARIIEKHFTINKNHSSFRDHLLSADPAELAMLVKRVKEAGQMLGDGKIPDEKTMAGQIKQLRRSIAASRDLKKGAVLSKRDFVWVRPGSGFPPGQEKIMIGKRLKKDVQQGEIFLKDHLCAALPVISDEKK